MKAYGKIINTGSDGRVVIEVERLHIEESLKAGNLVYDYELDQIYLNMKKVKLAFKEICFLKILMIRPNSVRSFEDISWAVWNRQLDRSTSQSIRTLVSQIRRKAPEISIVSVS